MTDTLRIAVSGLNAAVTRVANATSNIVNASSTSPLPATPAAYTGYVPKDVVAISQDTGDINLGVATTTRPRDPAYAAAFDPTSANANADGFIAVPNVDIAAELVETIAARVSYGASAAVIKVETAISKSLLDIKT